MTAFQDGITAGSALVGAADKSITGVAPVSNGNILTVVGGVWASAAPATSGTVTSVSGTANRITSTGGNTPIIDISASYVGQSSITTLGTVTTGTWNGTIVTPAFGGTGANNTATSGKILIGNGTNFVSSTPTFPNASATSGKIIKSDGTNWTASTETYAAPSTSGNVMTSDGTNWTSAAPAAGTWGGYTVTTVSGTLTNAQIKTLNANPVQIVAAQGAGKIIIPVQYCLKMAYGGTNVFTAAASQQIVLAYNGVASTTIVLSNAGIIASTSRIAYGQFTQSQSALYTTYANTALQFWNLVATEITGNAANDNTMPWTLSYIVVTI